MKIKYKFFWLSLIILFIAVFLPINGKAAGPSLDKLAHFLLFAFVSMNTCYYFLRERKYLIYASIFVCSLPYGTEYIQTFIKGRHFETKDIIADILGIVFGVILYYSCIKIIKRIYAIFGE